jgi:hypothetical protein
MYEGSPIMISLLFYKLHHARKFLFLNFEEIDSEEFLPKAFETKKRKRTPF